MDAPGSFVDAVFFLFFVTRQQINRIIYFGCVATTCFFWWRNKNTLLSCGCDWLRKIKIKQMNNGLCARAGRDLFYLYFTLCHVSFISGPSLSSPKPFSERTPRIQVLTKCIHNGTQCGLFTSNNITNRTYIHTVSWVDQAMDNK